MKIASSTIRILQSLLSGEGVSSGAITTVQQKEIIKFLAERHGVHYRRITKSRGVYTVTDTERFKDVCYQYDPSLNDFSNALDLAEGRITSRAEKTDRFGNSKQGGEDRTLKGFTLLAAQPIEVRYLGFDYPIGPLAGLHVVDRASLSIPENAAVLIVENAECLYNSSWIRNVGIQESGGTFILMYRSHITEEGKRWLESIPNRILYFGDFDLGGVRIYESEYKRRLGDRISFILPEDLEQRIRRNGNPELYTKQVNEGFANLTSPSGELTDLIELLHRLQSTYEQEGYCNG